MKLTSPAFPHGGSIPSQYTCDGANISPPLEISEIPSEAQSLALIMDDPDVPQAVRKDGIWDHWILFNMPVSTSAVKIEEGQEPEGTHGKGTAGNTGYFGPCPPDREHRYFFKLYALKEKIGLQEGAAKREVEEAMSGLILEKTELMGRYVRK
ncbi:MAG: YbhB/YbcL family Raf kinase inhibitor-like protein [Syntrophales bacterium]|nr:YbhB/YbcL family Raf kinase inhibitor-like protein [Syntrophales bacterium]MDY0043827.1 YbhB/YbcL family Raf kinase inhibitor-like protein [Syntrophales bacterium]